MAKPQRDDFPQRIITKLRGRVAHRCSNPDCRVPTSGPHHEDPEKSISVGEAAHIRGERDHHSANTNELL